MRISQVIAALAAAREKYGDLRVARAFGQDARTVVVPGKARVEAVDEGQLLRPGDVGRPGDKDGELVLVID